MKRLISAGIMTAHMASACVLLAQTLEPGARPATASGDTGPAAGSKHTVRKGETLWDLSGKYYGDPFEWGRIYSANQDKIADPDRIYPDEEISIPGLAGNVSPAPLPEKAAKAPPSGPVEETVSAVENSSSTSPAEITAPLSSYSPAPGAAPSSRDVSLLSEEMPKAQQEWTGNNPKIVPGRWRGDGVIVAKLFNEDESIADGLTEIGGSVEIKAVNPQSFRSGDVLVSYLKGAPAFDTKTGMKLGVKLQRTGTLKVVSVSGKKIIARVLSSVTSVGKGQLITREP